ncbi:hypothetical protein SAMN05421776_12312 [Nocardia farcinica]|uniref:Uncharacterized protein n=1 Tax=Nocardia farcinica TaxID=37329 RepID=A0A0H5P9F8_NOCFR|nr:hypothetical protein CJ469_05954 [Nocardia farcinica]PFX04347.1 hypothetical protein CJ468_05593 [Nocardia farcinica]CRY84352.1 Uncharacterised protein [Nocardia farcinica]SIT34271.1 hypothetical protein SAMN05421776_12312 [Nocardia farcinica]SLG33955.1 Uncharacterised protein [Mycobacteroides abscessus subsp. abscessus]
MSFADEVAAFEKPRPPCKTGEWLSELDKRDAAAFTEFLERGGAVADLHTIAVRNGCPARETQFRRHCRRRCSCYPRQEKTA